MGASGGALCASVETSSSACEASPTLSLVTVYMSPPVIQGTGPKAGWRWLLEVMVDRLFTLLRQQRKRSLETGPWGKGRGRSLQGTLQVPPQSSHIDGEVRLHTRAAYLQPPARAQGSLASVTVPRQGAREGTNNQITASLFICARNVHRFYSSPPIHHDLFVVSCPMTVCPVSQNITVILPNNTWVLISKTTKSRILWAGKQATRSFLPLPEGGTECASPGICLPPSWAKFRILMAFKFYIERNFIFDFCPVKNNSSFILRTMSPGLIFTLKL